MAIDRISYLINVIDQPLIDDRLLDCLPLLKKSDKKGLHLIGGSFGVGRFLWICFFFFFFLFFYVQLSRSLGLWVSLTVIISIYLYLLSSSFSCTEFFSSDDLSPHRKPWIFWESAFPRSFKRKVEAHVRDQSTSGEDVKRRDFPPSFLLSSKHRLSISGFLAEV